MKSYVYATKQNLEFLFPYTDRNRPITLELAKVTIQLIQILPFRSTSIVLNILKVILRIVESITV